MFLAFITKVCKGPVSAFDDVPYSLSAPAPTPSQRMRPSITVADVDAPSLSFALAKPMLGQSSEEDQPPVSFTLKAPRRSSSIAPVPEVIEANL